MTARQDFARALSPNLNARMNAASTNNTRFVHYTSASSAMSIIQKECVWMRSAAAVNDFSEVEHGRRCLRAAWNHEVHGNKLQSLMNSVERGLAKRLEQVYTDRFAELYNETFLISVSEHGSELADEDKYGRLSMWRAYGGNTNVALVLNNGPFIRESDATNAFTSPVLYCDETSFCDEFEKVVTGFEEHLDAAKMIGGEEVLGIVHATFNFATLSAKHKGFSEEKEWRVIHSPTLYPSEKISFDLENVGGVPQRVYKFPLTDFPDEGHFGVTIPELIEEIIIGPTSEGYLIWDALVRALDLAGVDNAAAKVKVSDIPLRR